MVGAQLALLTVFFDETKHIQFKQQSNTATIPGIFELYSHETAKIQISELNTKQADWYLELADMTIKHVIDALYRAFSYALQDLENSHSLSPIQEYGKKCLQKVLEIKDCLNRLVTSVDENRYSMEPTQYSQNLSSILSDLKTCLNQFNQKYFILRVTLYFYIMGEPDENKLNYVKTGRRVLLSKEENHYFLYSRDRQSQTGYTKTNITSQKNLIRVLEKLEKEESFSREKEVSIENYDTKQKIKNYVDSLQSNHQAQKKSCRLFMLQKENNSPKLKPENTPPRTFRTS